MSNQGISPAKPQPQSSSGYFARRIVSPAFKTATVYALKFKGDKTTPGVRMLKK